MVSPPFSTHILPQGGEGVQGGQIVAVLGFDWTRFYDEAEGSQSNA